MEVVNSTAGYASADATQVKRNLDPAQPKDGPHGQTAPEPKSRGEAVVFGGSLANLDPASNSRDAERQAKIERRDAERQQSAERREASHQRRIERREARHEVDVSA